MKLSPVFAVLPALAAAAAVTGNGKGEHRANDTSLVASILDEIDAFTAKVDHDHHGRDKRAAPAVPAAPASSEIIKTGAAPNKPQIHISTTGVVASNTANTRKLRIVQGTDDGWAEFYTRSLNRALRDAGHDVLLSAPARNYEKDLNFVRFASESTHDQVPPAPLHDPCVHNSCPEASQRNESSGFNASDPRLRWHNTYPVPAVRLGVEHIGPGEYWNGSGPDLVVAGLNTGSVFRGCHSSHVSNVAAWAASVGIPAVLFAAPARRGPLPWDIEPPPPEAALYSRLALDIIALLARNTDAAPMLPPHVYLNVNFPSTDGYHCARPEHFSYVLSHFHETFPSFFKFFERMHSRQCGVSHWPTAERVFKRNNCQVSISLGDATKRKDGCEQSNRDHQWLVSDKLYSILTCDVKTKH